MQPLVALTISLALMLAAGVGGIYLLLWIIRWFFRWLDSGWFIPARPDIHLHHVDEPLPAIGGAFETRR